jgi:uncharacterized membrane protein
MIKDFGFYETSAVIVFVVLIVHLVVWAPGAKKVAIWITAYFWIVITFSLFMYG